MYPPTGFPVLKSEARCHWKGYSESQNKVSDFFPLFSSKSYTTLSCLPCHPLKTSPFIWITTIISPKSLISTLMWKTPKERFSQTKLNKEKTQPTTTKTLKKPKPHKISPTFSFFFCFLHEVSKHLLVSEKFFAIFSVEHSKMPTNSISLTCEESISIQSAQ